MRNFFTLDSLLCTVVGFFRRATARQRLLLTRAWLLCLGISTHVRFSRPQGLTV